MRLAGSRDSNTDADVLSISGDPKGIAADGAGRSLEALDDVFMLSGNSWGDMVQEMESEKKSRGSAAGRIKRHTNREAFSSISVVMGCRLKMIAFSKPVLGVIFSIFIREEC